MLATVLQRFESALLASGAPSATRLRPGLSDAEAAELEERGSDLAALHRWHDGVEPEDSLRRSEETELCHVMPGLYFDGLWWMPVRRARELHAERGLSGQEWLLLDGLHEYVTYTSTHEVVAWDIEDGLQTRFPTLKSFFDLAAEAWEVGIFTWQEDVEEDFGGLIACDRPRLEVLISKRPEILRHPMG